MQQAVATATELQGGRAVGDGAGSVGRARRTGWQVGLDILIVAYAVALLVRLINLDLAITADEGYWMQRGVRFAAALGRGDLPSTYRSGPPGVTVMWVGSLGMGPRRLEPLLAGGRAIPAAGLESMP